MLTVNRVILIGRTGSAPDIRYTQSGTCVANFSLATDVIKPNNQGGYDKKTEWHRITAWDKDAEFCAKSLDKGMAVYIEGRLKTEEWEDKKHNITRYTTKIVASMVNILEKIENYPQNNQQSYNQNQPQNQDQSQNFSNYPPEDDIPF